MLAIVVGGDSRLGGALGEVLLSRGHDVILTTRHAQQLTDKPVNQKMHWEVLDLLNPRFPRQMSGLEHGVVVYLVAAVTGVVQCERDPQTWRVNADAPSLLAAVARCWGWEVVFVSSDAVECAPHTAYAMQKAHAEGVVLALGGHVVRPARIAPEKYAEVAKLLAEVGERANREPGGPGSLARHGSLTRWEG